MLLLELAQLHIQAQIQNSFKREWVRPHSIFCRGSIETRDLHLVYHIWKSIKFCKYTYFYQVQRCVGFGPPPPPPPPPYACLTQLNYQWNQDIWFKRKWEKSVLEWKSHNRILKIFKNLYLTARQSLFWKFI